MILIIIGLSLGFNYIFISLGKDFLINIKNLSQNDASDIIFLMGVSAIIGYLVNGFMLDRIGRKKTAIIFCLAVPSALLIAIAGNKAFVYVGTFIISISYWNLNINSRILSLELFPTNIRGQMTGWRTLSNALGITTAAFITSIIQPIIGLSMVFILFSMLLIITAIIIHLFIPETKNIDLDSESSHSNL
ncbi:MAG: MFS transporter [Promethearchaeota archaeon]